MSIHVVFFGGTAASQRNVDAWKKTAKKQRGDVKFDVFPYPAGTDSQHPVEGFSKKFDEAIKLIKATAADSLYIVGHSSGCAIANEVNSRLPASKSITLVDLDGFRVTPKQRKDSHVQAWWAEGPGGVGQSLNWHNGKIKYPAKYATNKYSLHFSLVNIEATNDITKENWWIDGYDDCYANLCFLDYVEPKTSGTP